MLNNESRQFVQIGFRWLDKLIAGWGPELRAPVIITMRLFYKFFYSIGSGINNFYSYVLFDHGTYYVPLLL